MKEIKAYIRPGSLARIIDRLEAEGARELAVTRADAIGALAEAEDDRLRRGHKYHEQYSDVAKVEIVCADAEVERFVSVLQEGAAHGSIDDGRIFVLNVQAAVYMGNDGKHEEALLESGLMSRAASGPGVLEGQKTL